MEHAGWDERHLRLAARAAGVAGIAYVVVQLLPGSLGGPLFDNVSTAQILDWVKHNGSAISLEGFIGALVASVLTFFMVFLVAVVRGRGPLASASLVAVAAFMAIDWVHAGTFYALADAGRRPDADAGIVALFSLTKVLTFCDGFVFGLALVAISVIALQSRTLPGPVAWLGLLVGAFHLVDTPIQLAISGTADGILGPISVVLVLLWVLTTSVLLVIRPIWRPGSVAEPAPVAS